MRSPALKVFTAGNSRTTGLPVGHPLDIPPERSGNALKPPPPPSVESACRVPVVLEFPVPASRAYWKGFLKLSFVSCPIALYPATSAAERLSFRQVNRRTGHRLKHKLVDSVTGEAVESSNKARGYEVGDNEFLLVEDRDLERARSERPPPGAVEIASRRESPPTVPAGVHEQDDKETADADDDDDDKIEEEIAPRPRPENTHTIEIERFLPAGQIDARYFEKPYYIVPREQIGQESFAVIRDAMRREGVIGLARVVLSSRERHFLIEPMESGLRGVTLRGADDYFAEIPEIKLPAEMMKLAQHIIRTKSDKFDPAMLEDHYRTALVGILSKKRAKRPAQHAPDVKPSRENVVSLMDTLRRSIAAERPAKSAPRRGVDKRAASKRAAKAR
jgi:Ku protein